MYYLVKSMLYEDCGGYDLDTRLLVKSKSPEPLRRMIKELFDEAVEGMDENGLVNNCSKEMFDFDEGIFYENMLSVYELFPSPGIERRTIDYVIVTDEGVEEV